MNKEKTLEQLEIARQIVSSDTPFEYNAYGIWRNPRIGLNALRYCANGHEIRIKPEPDKFAELKKAHADGKTIQVQWSYNKWSDVDNPGWFPEDEYRIKPEPVKIPLGPEDVPPGSVLRGPSDKLEVWAAAMAMTPHGIMLADSRSVSFTVIEKGWVINRSIPLTGKWDTSAWEPCYKDVEQ